MLSRVLLLCILASGLSGEEDTVESHVIDLTTETFDDAIASNPVILVEFFAPWYVVTWMISSMVVQLGVWHIIAYVR